MQYATKDDIDKVTQHIDDLEVEIMSGLQTVYEEINETNRKYAWIRGGLTVGLPLLALCIAIAIV